MVVNLVQEFMGGGFIVYLDGRVCGGVNFRIFKAFRIGGFAVSGDYGWRWRFTGGCTLDFDTLVVC